MTTTGATSLSAQVAAISRMNRLYSLSLAGRQTAEALRQTEQAERGAPPGTLSRPAKRAAGIVLRSHEAGDMGWIIQRHAQIYRREHGFDATFEAFCARIAAEFIENFDAATERCWIAEVDEQRAGSALVVNAGAGCAQIRLVLVEPQARGRGLGRRLIRECVRFAARKKYLRIGLWTNDNLHAARHIYASEGFELIGSEAHHSFGHDLVGENWQRPLP